MDKGLIMKGPVVRPSESVMAIMKFQDSGEAAARKRTRISGSMQSTSMAYRYCLILEVNDNFYI